jgi:hypothetical protein
VLPQPRFQLLHPRAQLGILRPQRHQLGAHEVEQSQRVFQGPGRGSIVYHGRSVPGCRLPVKPSARAACPCYPAATRPERLP